MNARVAILPERGAGRSSTMAQPSGPAATEVLRFSRYTLLPAARLLLRDGRPVEIGSRAFDLLHILAGRQGEIVGRGDIMRHVWPTTVVDDSNLRFQVSCLRRALGPERVLLKTIPGRGYLLAVELTDASDAASPGDGGDELRALLRLVLNELRSTRRPPASV